MEKWLDKYFQILQDKPDMREIEWRSEMVPLLIHQGLGYDAKNIRFEKDRTDIKIIDERDIHHIVFETKISERKLGKSALRQALTYLQGGESFIVLAAPSWWRVYRPENKPVERMMLIGEIRFNEEDGIENKSLFLILSKSMMRDDERFSDFRKGISPAGFIKLDNIGFKKLVNALQLSFDMLYRYADIVWPHQLELYSKYSKEKEELDNLEEDVKRSGRKEYVVEESLHFISDKRRKLERKYAVQIEAVEKSYHRFLKIQPYSKYVSEKQVTTIYLNEVCHLALNRALMIRVLEDKRVLNPKISNGGIRLWRELTTFIRERYQYLLRFSFWDAELLYHHFFTEGIFDWYLKVDGELGDVMEIILFLLNSFDFSNVDRDILGQVYQEFFNPDKRKKLGEFYTPPEVIKYLLERVGWPAEGKLLDFACGSGGFLVEALKQSMDEAESRGLSAEARWRLAENIVGFDINPFAVHITEMNLLSLMIDLFEKIVEERKKKGEPVQLPDLEVFRIDALLDGRELDVKDNSSFHFDAWPGERFDDALAARELKEAYRYIVGNPPYIRNERLDPAAKKWYDDIFENVKEGNTDIYALFVKKALDWLEPGGQLGIIVSQGLADSRSSAKVRRYVEQYTIEELVPLEWADVFMAAINPFLLIIKKERTPTNHKIRIRQGTRDIRQLENSDFVYTNVKQSDWVGLAPDGSWRMEVTDDDLPILRKLSKYKTPFSGSYGMTLRSDEKLIDCDISEMEQPIPVLDGREIKAWSIEWQGRYIDYIPSKISDPKTQDFFESTSVVLPRISLTAQASVLENNYYFRDTVMKIESNTDLESQSICSFINSKLNRYYSFLILRVGIIQSGWSTFFPRVISKMIIPPLYNNVSDRLCELGQKCKNLAHEMYNGDRELIDKIDALMGLDKINFADLPNSDLSSLAGEINLEEAGFNKEGALTDGSLFILKGDSRALYFIANHAQLIGKSSLRKQEIENYSLPRSREILEKINDIIRNWLERKPTLVDRLRQTESDIDDIIFDACDDLTKEDIDTIKHRCTEFPLSEVLKTSLPGVPTRHIPIKIYKDRFK